MPDFKCLYLLHTAGLEEVTSPLTLHWALPWEPQRTDLIHSMIAPRLGFSGSADRMVLFAVR